jgi:hypothetical protein
MAPSRKPLAVVKLPVYGVVKDLNVGLSLNWYRNAHFRDLAKAKKTFRFLIYNQLQQLKPFEGQLFIIYTYYARQAGTDLDNFTSCHKKFFQDCLTTHKLIKDDNCKYIPQTMEVYGGIDRKDPRVEALIYKA